VDSILTSIKKLLGIEEDYEYFDTDIIFGINSALSVLTQVGVGPSKGFAIQDKTAKWTDFLSPIDARLELAKSYVHLKTKLIFDPPATSFLIESSNKIAEEFLWRITVAVETG